jgi:hypothetical protein
MDRPCISCPLPAVTPTSTNGRPPPIAVHTTSPRAPAHRGSRSFVPPPGHLQTTITAEKLQSACEKAEDIDQVINDLEVVLTTLKQANLLFDAEAWELLRRVNDQVKAQMKYAPELEGIFRTLLDFMARKRSAPQTPTET